LFERIYGPTLAGSGPALLDSAITEPFIAHTAGHSPIGAAFVGLEAFKGHIALPAGLAAERCGEHQTSTTPTTTGRSSRRS
jgi:hypothetical protein